MCPNGTMMHATHAAELNFAALPLAARLVKLVPNLTSGTLVSVGQLCDNGCQALFHQHSVTIFYDNRPVLYGTRPGLRSLWTLTPSTMSSIPLYFLPSRKLSTLVFSVVSLVSPPVAYVTTRPSLLLQSKAIKTPYGKESNLLKPTPPPKPKLRTPSLTRTLPTRTHDVLAAFADISGKAFSDLPGDSDISSSRGNKCVLVLYDYDSNFIFAASIPSTNGKAPANAHDTMFATLTAARLKPKLLLLDNSASKYLKKYLTSTSVDFQLVPPHNHRRNAAERAIRTWKNHFIAILAATNDGFPLYLWDMLRKPISPSTSSVVRASIPNSRLTPKSTVSLTTTTPLAPPGTRAFAHEAKDTCRSWAAHTSEGWYVGPALDSYRCFTIWMDHTRRTRLVERVTWFPTKVHVPVPTTAELISATLDALRATLSVSLPGKEANVGVHVVLHCVSHTLQGFSNVIQNFTKGRNYAYFGFQGRISDGLNCIAQSFHFRASRRARLAGECVAKESLQLRCLCKISK
jgi:hypothetical protein